MRYSVLVLVLCFLALTVCACGQNFTGKDKKIIEYGWDVRSPAFVRDNVSIIEKYPFDGLVMTPNKNHAFDINRWTADQIQPERDAIKAIKWKKFTDNFIIIHSANHWNMDWFNDAHWEVILANAADFASIAKAGNCAGIIFDPEPYGNDPWAFPAAFGNHSMDEVTVQLQKRGKQWVQALQKNWPDMKLLTFFFSPNSSIAFGAFCTGMIEGAKDNVKIINGNESSYYHTSYQHYVGDWNNMVVKGAQIIKPELNKQYKKHFQAGMALYMDQTLALREPKANFLSYYMTEEDRLKFFEATVYWALKTTDEYVWCYSEKMDWWKGTQPAGAEDAIIRAKAKLMLGESLGYSMDVRVKNAADNRERSFVSEITGSTAEIKALPAGTAAPTIDGKGNDDAWRSAQALLDFVLPRHMNQRIPDVRTYTKVTYDDTNIYLLVQCNEEDMSKLTVTGKEKDSNVWSGDDFEIFISTGPDDPEHYRHFIVNPDNGQWDGMAPPEENDASWDADWKSATAKDETSWTAEFAIPWSALEGKPAAGSIRHVNLCRQSTQSGYFSWSPLISGGFQDPDSFGTWTFMD